MLYPMTSVLSADVKNPLVRGDSPVTVEADDGIEWISEKKMYVARGNARATRGTMSVVADTLTALYRDTEGDGTEIHRLEARGRVVIKSPERTAFGDRAIYDLDQTMAVMYGQNLRLVTKGDTITASDSLEYWEKRRVAVARGNAVAIRRDRRIRADVLKVLFREKRAGALEAVRMDALGNVVITTPQEVAQAREGVYNAKSGIATLSGDVKITKGKTQLNGEVAEVNLNSGISRLLSSRKPSKSGRVRGIFVPNSNKN
ncbi:LptA/OstA family protein [Ponticaulis sp.]|uniref:LptA/OstA family protein n=1 Tax=Ponticaulis sp. TaxID=2020902 RepID=UPI000C4D6870|nr:LptA/OstA family protein [Ponticaulis sp.]MBN06140.1 hypothetical protein [Ponticaulis sp.]